MNIHQLLQWYKFDAWHVFYCNVFKRNLPYWAAVAHIYGQCAEHMQDYILDTLIYTACFRIHITQSFYCCIRYWHVFPFNEYKFVGSACCSHISYGQLSIVTISLSVIPQKVYRVGWLPLTLYKPFKTRLATQQHNPYPISFDAFDAIYSDNCKPEIYMKQRRNAEV